MQWAMNGRLGDAPLLEACLLDQRFDIQVEDSRGDWLWRIVRTVGSTDRFRVPILHALYELSDDRSAEQVCELARRNAEAGDEPFRARLYEIVERTPCTVCPWLGKRKSFLWTVSRVSCLPSRCAGEDWPGVLGRNGRTVDSSTTPRSDSARSALLSC
jgi:hypothetical protein